MFENELQTRAAICGTGCLLGLVLVLAHLPLLSGGLDSATAAASTIGSEAA